MKQIYYILAFLLALGSCGKKDIGGLDTKVPDTNPTGIGKVTDIITKPGRNRLELSFRKPADLGEVKLSKYRIHWNSGKDSLEVSANTTADSVLVLMNNLEEGTYVFSISAYDNNGKKSAAASAYGRTYGEKYQSELINRLVTKAFLGGISGTMMIDWEDARPGTLGSEVTYTDASSTLKTLLVPVTDASTMLKDVMVGGKVTYRSLFVPQANAIDTFYTDSAPINVSALTAQAMVIDDLEGPITQNEILKFRGYMNAKVSAPAYSGGNVWVYGNSGKAMEACGLMYESTNDIEILNRMIYYADAALAGRNDLAPASEGGQRLAWTGAIEPIWTSDAITVVTKIGAGVEQGEVLSHMLYCSKLILENPSIWNMTVGIGDSKGYGATYKERALKYIREADHVIEKWILPRFVTRPDKRFYFPGAPNEYKPNDPAPWNQLFMLTDGFIRLVQCHVLLGDAPAKVAEYDAIVKANLNWFFSSSNLKPSVSKAGTKVYTFPYASPSGMEDANHFAYDVQGLWIAYDSGRYGLTSEDLMPFANTYVDVVLATITNGIYAGKIDGTTGSGNSGGDNYVRDEYIYLTQIRPEQFERFAIINQSKIPSSPQITARLLWAKNRRYLNPPQ